MFKRLFHFAILSGIILSLLVITPATPAQAAGPWVVTNTTDTNDGTCDSNCSLREAVIAAASGDTVDATGVTGIITLSLGEIAITGKTLTIVGPGADQLTVSGNDLYRVFNVTGASTTTSISGLTIDHGYCEDCAGGGIRAANVTSLTLDQVLISNSVANTNIGYPRGGGVGIDGGTLIITNSTIMNNSADYAGGGVAVFNSSSLNMTNVVVHNNNLTTGPFGGNGGGGISLDTNDGYSSTLTNVTISNNSSVVDGGGLYVRNHTMSLIQSTIKLNSATDDGAGLYIENSTITISAATFNTNSTTGNSNSDGGAIFHAGASDTSTLTIRNSTFSGNTALGFGGAIENHAGGGVIGIATTAIINSTIVENNASNSGYGGGIFAGNANSGETSSITLSNSIVYGNTISNGTNGENCGSYNTAVIITASHNLFNALPNDCVAGGTDITDIGLLSTIVNPLANNGGSTQTRSLPGSSPAIDTGNDSVCAAAPVSNTSQNGVTRPQGSHCDIGAYEFVPSGPTTINVTIAGTSMGNYPMVPETSQVLKYLVDGGPVVIGNNDGIGIIASLNQWRRNAAQPADWFTGVAQSMALPVEQITNRYVMPRYNGTNPTLYDAVLMANVDTVPRTITVTIGGTVMGTYPLNPSQSVYATYPIVGGPIVVSSVTGARIVASLYELKRSQAGVPWNGQSEMMGLPSGQLSDKYLLPIYFGAANPATLDARLYFANVDTVATTVEVKIAGVSRGTYPMAPSTSMEVKYLVDGGPVEISSNNGAKIVASLNQWRRNAAEPAEWFTGVAQSMALPVELITDKYVIPRYNGTDPTLYDAVLMANVDTVPRTITVKIGATVMGTYPLNPSASVYATYPIADGPIVVSSDVGAKIVASLYELKRYQAGVPWNGQSEMMGLPFGQLSDQYLLPIYFGAANPLTLDARLYIAVP